MYIVPGLMRIVPDMPTLHNRKTLSAATTTITKLKDILFVICVRFYGFVFRVREVCPDHQE